MAEPKKKRREDEDARSIVAGYLEGLKSLEPEAEERDDAYLLRRRPDGRVDTLRHEGPSTSTYVGGVDEKEARKMWRGGYRMATDDEFEWTKHGGQVQAPEGSTPFIRDVHRHAVPEGYSNTGPADAKKALADAAGMGRGFRGGEPSVEVTEGTPQLVSRKPAAPARRPGISVGMPAEGRSGVDVEQLARKPLGGLEKLAQSAPEVASYMQGQLGDDGLAAAQDAARRRNLSAQLVRASAHVNEAISGARYDRDFYDDLQADSGRPVTELQARRKSAADAEALVREAEEAKMRREDTTRRWDVNDRDFKYRQQRDEVEDERAAAEAAAEAERFEAQQRAQASDRALRREEMGARRQEAEEGKGERQRAALEQRQKEGLDRSLQKLATDTEEAGLMKDDLGVIIGALNSEGNDLPGVGPLAGGLPELFLSEEGTRLRQATIRAYRTMLRLESGLTVTDDEAAAQLEAYGVGGGKSEDAFRRGMASLAQRARRALSNAESGYDEDVVKERQARGGVTSRDIPAPGPRPTGERIRMADGSMWEVLDNGKARPVRR